MSRIRITGGDWRSRLIEVTDAPGLRPTPDRVRETLFNWLGQDLSGWKCLDLFAGSGILGLEAASRGAAHVTLVEQNRRVFSQLQRNAGIFDCPRLRLVCDDALKFVRSEKTAYDLVLMDPPYRQGLLDAIVPYLPSIASAGAYIYAEAEHRIERLGDWQVIRQGQAGKVFFHLMERQ
jgi:16S rRNA (guanine(966)-N(2))-methyltransferase RsmD